MKQVLFFISSIILLLSCKKNNKVYTGELVNNWKAIEWQNDIGNGSTPFSTIPSNYNYYFNFSANGSFEANYLFNTTYYNRYYIKDSVTIQLYKLNTTDSMSILYQFANNNEQLILSFRCIEPCRVKLVRK